MKEVKLGKRVKNLKMQIDDLRYKYHVLNDPSVTDAMYQGLINELKKIEDKNPSLKTKDSPTQRVAGTPLDTFKKIKHQIPQWSLMDAFDRKDLQNWEERLLKILEKKIGSRPKDIEYICELKIDGLHIVLTYNKGALITAATRGDGKVGEDVTQNIRTIYSVPLNLKKPASIVVEGEVWMDSEEFIKINKEREKKSLDIYANPRNFAAGTIRQLDPKIVSERKLSVTAYDISSKHTFSQAEELNELKSLGFKTDNHWKVCRNTEQIMDFYFDWEKKKHSKEYWIDGVVIKVNQKKYQDLLGYTGKSPRWSIAMKFPAEQGTTIIKDIYVQVGRTGALTPVALMQPVRLAGTTVTHATLHNFDEISRLDVRIGDTVVVEKAGDIIPKIIRVLTKMRTGREKKINEIKNCPICGSVVQRKEILDKKKIKSAALFCSNKKCFAKLLKNIIHFVSKKAFNIDGMGKKIVEQLMNEGLIKNTADIFYLSKSDLENLNRFAEKSAENLIISINSAREITLPRLIFSFGIPHVGEESAIALAGHFGRLEKIRIAKKEELENVVDVGPRVADSIINYFSDESNKKIIDKILENITINSYKKKSVGRLNGKSFVFTGTLEKISRDNAKEIVRKNSGKVSSSISSKIDYLVAGKNPGTKYKKAKELGINVIDESEFLLLLS